MLRGRLLAEAAPSFGFKYPALGSKRTKDIRAFRGPLGYPATMLDKSIDGALLALRKQIIRESKPGREHVEALLALRGVPAPRVLPAKRGDVAKRWETRRFVLRAFKDGPTPLAELVGLVRAWKPDVPERLAYGRTAQALYKLRDAGLVTPEGERGRYVWRLAP
jgi:hypothetical protein